MSLLEIAAISDPPAEAIEAHGREVMTTPAFGIAVFRIPVLRMSRQPRTGLVHPFLERCEFLFAERRCNSLAHDEAFRTNITTRRWIILWSRSGSR